MYHSVIFDIDGTLIETDRAIISSLQRVLKEELGKDLEESDLDFLLGLPAIDILKRLEVDDINRALKKWDDYQRQSHSEMSVYPEIEEVLKTLIDRGIITGIVTSKSKEEFKNDFDPFELTRYFTYIISADDTEKHKPDPDPLIKFAEIAKVAPETILYVGDTLYDLNCAKSAGIDFALAQWGTKKSDEIPARIKLNSPKQLLSVVFLEPSP
jgi:HAD superfamily hydrolase (TIGR01549 family)